MKRINASIITIGDELLIGQTLDTNSAWMAEELNKIGVWVKRRVAVGDVWDDIWNALDEERKQADIILITGGLGPTADDITKPLLCKYFGGKLVTNEQVLAHVKYLFEKVFRRPGPILERNLKQAEVPDVCTVLMNERGTAPGMWFTQLPEGGVSKDSDKKVFVSLPGVPHEMKGLMRKEVLPRLQQHFKMPFILHQTFLTYGIGESFLAEKIKDWEENLPAHFKLAYLPHYGNVRLRITTTGDHKNKLEEELVGLIREKIGALAWFKNATIVKRLPKTRSGKILRKIICKIADGVEYTVPPTIDDPLILTEISEKLKERKIGVAFQ